MKALIAMTSLVAILSGLLLAADGENPPKSYDGGSKHVLNRSSPDLTKVGKWGEWKFWYVSKGTRSEGLHGELVVDGEKKTGKKLGEKFEAEGRTWIWHGTWNDRKQLFSKSGWLPEDLATVYPSWNLKAEQNGADQPATAPQSKLKGNLKPRSEPDVRPQ